MLPIAMGCALLCAFGAGVCITRLGVFNRIALLIYSSRTPTPVERPIGICDENTYCVVVAGQSNVASHGAPRGRAGKNCFALTASGWYVGDDPWPGGSGTGGSVWSRLSPEILDRKIASYVVIGCVAVGSSRVEDWSSGGRLCPKLDEIAQAFAKEQLKVDVVIWHQGETESWQKSADPIEYRRHLSSLVDRWRTEFPNAKIIVCQTSRDGQGVVHPGIRAAQLAVCDISERVVSGPDTDELDDSFRHDGVHWNEKGMKWFAKRLLERL